MRLYFLRHAIAVEHEQWEGPDSERPLTDEGRAKFETVARGLAALDLRPDAIYTSPFTRAADTAHIIAAALEKEVTIWSELASGCDLERLAPRLAKLEEARAVMLVGHEPDFSAMIGRLIGGATPACLALKKGACCRVDVSRKAIRSGDRRGLVGSGELAWLLTPGQLTHLAPVARSVSPTGHRGPAARGNSSTPRVERSSSEEA
ncbi:MAG: phosphohistidine phosphatase SixA [Ktedonobacterales bacterium]